MSGKHGLLDKIDSPADLKGLQVGQLAKLAEEIRSLILDVVAVNAGHLGASLGAVELAVALHYVFDTPEDKIVWDVGHQAYAHKILTGRREAFASLRRWEGLSGFPSRDESIYDCFGTGHASTALSAALGLAHAARMQGQMQRHHIAVVGDGAMTGGMFFEALNQAGKQDVNLLIVLNDNDISIDKTSGALREYLSRVRRGDYGEQHPLFEAFGIPHLGLADGHDAGMLVSKLQEAKAMAGVKLLHVVTTKGKGFGQAELEQVLFHSPGRFDRLTGKLYQAHMGNRMLWQHVFGQTMAELAAMNPRIAVITPAMPTGSSVNMVAEKFPDRVFDVDIAEQHALTFSAGLAAGGMLPYCVVYSTFLQRAMDQLIHDIALQKLPVVLCIDRAGLVGEDGATHQGAFDLAFLRSIPNLTLAAPMDAGSLRNLLFSAQHHSDGPITIRYPRGPVERPEWDSPPTGLEIGKGRRLTQGDRIAILSLGAAGQRVQQALELLGEKGLYPSHYDLIFAKPLDEALLKEAFANHASILTVEDGVLAGGLGSAVLEWASANGCNNKVVRLGMPDSFVHHGKVEQQLRHCGLDAAGIAEAVWGMGDLARG
ncbi:MAG: 1-deoxy-D-xylulose-5-phosphate synthase [Bacteroidetes bacterium]|nr:1-deoxy-D-xylulose-5-phosphate synthase [Bacteroidota bacterium]